MKSHIGGKSVESITGQLTWRGTHRAPLRVGSDSSWGINVDALFVPMKPASKRIEGEVWDGRIRSWWLTLTGSRWIQEHRSISYLRLSAGIPTSVCRQPTYPDKCSIFHSCNSHIVDKVIPARLHSAQSDSLTTALSSNKAEEDLPATLSPIL